jgi:hypothetical protein
VDNVDTPSYSVLPFSPSQARQPLNEDVPAYRIARVHVPLTANDEIVPIGESVESLTTLDSCVLFLRSYPWYSIFSASKATTLRQWLKDVQQSSTSNVILEASCVYTYLSKGSPPTDSALVLATF